MLVYIIMMFFSFSFPQPVPIEFANQQQTHRVNRQERQHRPELVCSRGTYQTHFSFSSNHGLKRGKREYKSLHKDMKKPAISSMKDRKSRALQKNAPLSNIKMCRSAKHGLSSPLKNRDTSHFWKGQKGDTACFSEGSLDYVLFNKDDLQEL